MPKIAKAKVWKDQPYDTGTDYTEKKFPIDLYTGERIWMKAKSVMIRLKHQITGDTVEFKWSGRGGITDLHDGKRITEEELESELTRMTGDGLLYKKAQWALHLGVHIL
jgi:hypothetical protein